ncbi:MAG: hypothetical protein JTT13_06440 [Candidatus Brockarchaeota archaeon]|nr:hypothetical protein [Candidatus Brockarchaeota archaeon]
MSLRIAQLALEISASSLVKVEKPYLRPVRFPFMGGRGWRRLLSTLLFSAFFTLLLLVSLSSPFNRHLASAAPSTYSWTSLKTDTVAISYSINEEIWYGGTGYLHVDARAGQGKYSDRRLTTARVTVPEGFSAGVYVCGDDRNPVPNGWTVEEKYLRLEVDGNRVYELGKEYWWARCYSKAAVLSPGTHEVELTIGIAVKVSSNFEERDLAYAAMDIRLEGGGTVMAESHSAEATLDGEATHVFTFMLPEATGVRNMSWKATWNGIEKTGSGTPGGAQKAVFQGVNRDCWFFTSPVAIRVGEAIPSVSVGGGYAISAVFDEGSNEAGIHKIAVAISDGDEVGFTSAKYLVTEIRRETKVVGGTPIGSAIWTNSGSIIEFNQTIRYYDSSGWVTEKIRGSVETGSGVTKVFQELNVSRKVSFSSKNRSDELELKIRVSQLTLVFTHIVVSAGRNGGNVDVKACWAHDNSPIAGLRVRCFETDQSGVTDFNGRVSFRIVGSGFEATIYPTEGRNGITAYEKARVRL